jgi:hypothetical protein
MSDLVTLTATWVGKLKRRADEEVANALGGIAQAHPEHRDALESHFRGFCIATGATIDSLWAQALAAQQPEGVTALNRLRAMYWADNPGVETLETKGYQQVKYHLEHVLGYWKCTTPVGYARVDKYTGDISVICLSKMRDILMDVHYATVNDEGIPESVLIGPRWLSDEEKRRYDRVVVDPSMEPKANEFNIWPGFAAEKLPPVAPDLVAALIAPILAHIHDVLASGVENHFKYIVDWMAFLVQHPTRRTQTLILFQGQQGTGKGLIWDFLREHVLGHKVCTQSANAKNDLFDRFSNGFLHKRLVQLDEVFCVSFFVLGLGLSYFFGTLDYWTKTCGDRHRTFDSTKTTSKTK